MTNNRILGFRNVLNTGAAGLAMGVALLSAGAMGQVVAPGTPQDAKTNVANTDEIVVTGTLIRSPNLQSASPITTVAAGEIKAQGTTSIENVLNQLPQVSVNQSSSVSNGSNGTATVDLRTLGPDRTLVLLDGRRLPPGDPSGNAGGISGSADVNNIPVFLVKRIDVLTGGASTTYGADAVAGVVNFVLDNSFEGLRGDIQGEINQHNNGNSLDQSLIRADPRFGSSTNPITFPSGNTVDGGNIDAGIAFGAKLGDRGHLVVYGAYHHQTAVLQDSRDYSSCGLSNTTYNGGGPVNAIADDYSCAGSSNTAQTSFLSNSGAARTRQIITPGIAGGPAGVRDYVAASDAYNFNPINYLQRPDTRYLAGFYADYDVNDSIHPYASFNFMDDQSVAQIAPSGTFNNVFQLNCSNPLLSASQAGAFGCAAPGPGSLQVVGAALAKRNVEGGGRQDDLRHTDYRLVGGVRGEIANGLNYDVSAQYGTVIYAENYRNDFSRTRVQNALNACLSPNGSVSSDAGCSPYNIFSGSTTLQPNAGAGVTQQALNYVLTPGFKSGSTKEWVVNATINADLSSYGFQSPFADQGISLAFGGEYRREQLTLNTDAEFSTGDLLGQGGQTKSSSGAFDVREGFAEVNIPLASGRPGFQSLSFNGGYRYSDYTTVGGKSTYKLALNWAPFSGPLEGLVRFRGSFNQATRAPTVQDFFQPAQLGLGGTIDPCAQRTRGRASAQTLANCLLTAQGDPNFTTQFAGGFGIARNPASQYNSITAGAATAGTRLDAETAYTKTVGVVIQPRSLLPGFSASVDYYNINISNVINRDGYNTILNQCLATGSNYYCGLIHRDPLNGSLWLTPNGYITDPVYNAGHFRTEGIDVEAAYSRPFFYHTRLAFSFIGTYLLNRKIEVNNHNADGSISSNGLYNCAGFYGDNCGVPNPKWRHSLRVTLIPDDHVSLSANWRHIGSTNIEAANHDLARDGSGPLIGATGADGNPQPVSDFRFSRLSSYDYFDLSVSFAVTKGFALRGGVNNAFDRDPGRIPSADLGAGNTNGNTYGGLYDQLGRTIFMGLSFSL